MFTKKNGLINFGAQRHYTLTTHKEICYNRKLKNPTKGIVLSVKVLKEDYGFDGYLGYAAGHPALLGMSMTLPIPKGGRTEDDEISEKEDKESDNNSLESYLKAQAESGSTMTVKELLDTWQARKPAKEVIVVAEAASPSTTSSVSTITTDTSRETTPKNPAQEPVSEDDPPATPTAPPTPKAPPTATTTSTAPTIVTNESATQVPVTPVKKRGRETTNFSKLPPGTKSPERMMNGNHSWGCDHDALKGFVPCDRRYFTKKECEKPNYPTACSGCHGLLVRGVDKTREVPIKGILNVMVCKNAYNHRDHECVYALCFACYQEKLEERRSPKKQRKTNTGAKLLPGEVLLPDGQIGV